ncbi:MAG: alkaline phosphatase family protein [Propionicimonas sp.]
MSEAVVPSYGNDTLSDLLPSLGAHLAVPGATDRLGIPDAQRYVVLLVDGLGWHQRDWWTDAAPYLAELAGRGRSLTCGVPSTTVTSITSLGTGLTPGEHGMAGYSFRYPPIRAVLNALLWAEGVHGLDVQPQLTYLERLANAGVWTASVAPARFAGSGLTTAALRDPRFIPVTDESDLARRVELATQAIAGGDRALVYVYERALDHAGHTHGVGAPEWLAELRRSDELAARLRAALAPDIRLVITGDHGMVNVPQASRLVVEDEPELLQGVALLGGEGRLRQLYTEPGKQESVAARWRDRLGATAWVVTRGEAFDLGWFGPSNARVADRFGDVLVAMRNDGAVMSRTLAKELTLVGMHGSLTAAEMAVPLLVA